MTNSSFMKSITKTLFNYSIYVLKILIYYFLATIFSLLSWFYFYFPKYKQTSRLILSDHYWTKNIAVLQKQKLECVLTSEQVVSSSKTECVDVKKGVLYNSVCVPQWYSSPKSLSSQEGRCPLSVSYAAMRHCVYWTHLTQTPA